MSSALRNTHRATEPSLGPVPAGLSALFASRARRSRQGVDFGLGLGATRREAANDDGIELKLNAQFRDAVTSPAPARTGRSSRHARGVRRLKSSAISRIVTKRTPGFELMCANSRSCIASTCGRPETSGWMVMGKIA